MMKNDKKIEKELFLVKEPCPENIKEKKTTGDKRKKEIIKWKPMENKVKKNADSDDTWEKIFIAVLVALSPFILFYELVESLSFKLSRKKHRKEYRNMVADRMRYVSKYIPSSIDVDDTLYCNTNRYVIHYSTSEQMYPECSVSLWMPDSRAEDFPRIPWLQAVEVVSVKLPYIFHSCGYNVSDLKEKGWLADFQQKWNLSNAVVVINYRFPEDYEKRLQKLRWWNTIEHPFLDEDWEDERPLECFVELLIDKEPMNGLQWEKVKYRLCVLGTFQLERREFDLLTDSSRKKLHKMLNEYGLSKFWFL